MSGAGPKETAITSEQERIRAEAAARTEVAVRQLGVPNAARHAFDFWDDSYEWRRLFGELLGTFLLVTVAVGGDMVNARFGGSAIPPAARTVSPALMVMAVILFMGAVSGAHLNPVVSIAFALRGDFPWRRVLPYVAAQFAAAVLATLLLIALVGRQGSAGETLPGTGVSTWTALGWETLLTAGLVSVVLGTASGAQQLGPVAAFGVGSYIALAGLVGAPVSGASMNPARSLGPALVLGDWRSWWAYLLGPAIGALIAVPIAFVLRGPGGGTADMRAAQGTLGTLWLPTRARSPATHRDAASGPGPGSGPGAGRGPGPGSGPGSGPGAGRGPGPGSGPGAGRGHGPGSVTGGGDQRS